MKILLTNDDGYSFPGIQILYNTLSVNHDVVLAAPDRERSAVGHGITLNQPLRMYQITLDDGQKGYAITGTPTDCVKLSLFELFKTPPDLVISGINSGSNTGINLNYSGTVGAAREATFNGILSMAVSIQHGENLDFEGMAQFVNRLAVKLVDNGLPPGTFLNVNAPDIPFDKLQGVRITRQASNNLSSLFEKREDPKKNSYFWYGQVNEAIAEPDTDEDALIKNYISITPIQCDITDYKTMVELEELQLY
ncbi:MAG: 5'/3'-nucleotidase SurE [Desulfobacteraceae bacterium]|nr:5'/3'-nucleotidase SurE [Desulfobacteraceae bacterium]